MKDWNKTVILPLLMVLGVVVQLVFGVEIPESVLNDVAVVTANVIALVVVVIGIFKNHKKDSNKEE